jgi:hypothetical protein
MWITKCGQLLVICIMAWGHTSSAERIKSSPFPRPPSTNVFAAYPAATPPPTTTYLNVSLFGPKTASATAAGACLILVAIPLASSEAGRFSPMIPMMAVVCEAWYVVREVSEVPRPKLRVQITFWGEAVGYKRPKACCTARVFERSRADVPQLRRRQSRALKNACTWPGTRAADPEQAFLISSPRGDQTREDYFVCRSFLLYSPILVQYWYGLLLLALWRTARLMALLLPRFWLSSLGSCSGGLLVGMHELGPNPQTEDYAGGVGVPDY